MTSGAVFFLTLLLLLRSGEDATAASLAVFLFGYSASMAGAFVGALWGYAYGFVLAALFAFLYNLSAAPSAPTD